MKTLYLVRHAKTEKIASTHRDFDRNLLPKGIQDAHRMAQQFRKMHNIPKVCLTSAANRALETAQIFAQEFDFPKKQIRIHPELYETTLEELISFFQAFDPTWDFVMVFGHNPLLEETLSFLLADDSETYSLSPGTVTGISLEIQEWRERLSGKGTLLFLYDPKAE